jgi:hypothetical protein
MSASGPTPQVTVGVVVERRKSSSPWADIIWQPVAVLFGVPEAAPWTQLGAQGETVTFYIGSAEIALHRAEVDNYRRNLASGAPSVWVALQATGSEPPLEIAAVTVDPAEGEGLTEPGQAIVEAVAMPQDLREALAVFVAEHPVAPPFDKRQRDRADPEAMARHDRRLEPGRDR